MCFAFLVNTATSIILVNGVPFIDHEVDDYAGDGDVEPEGQGPAGDDAMLVEFLEPGAAQGNED